MSGKEDMGDLKTETGGMTFRQPDKETLQVVLSGSLENREGAPFRR